MAVIPSHRPLDMIIRVEGKQLLVSVSGDLDSSAADALATGLSAALDVDEGDVVLDLGGLTFVDIAGMRVVEEAHHRFARRGRTLTLAAASQEFCRLVGLLDLQSTLRMGQLWLESADPSPTTDGRPAFTRTIDIRG